MIPATNANNEESKAGDKNGRRITNPITAPTGSAKPAKNEYRNAFFLSPVA